MKKIFVLFICCGFFFSLSGCFFQEKKELRFDEARGSLFSGKGYWTFFENPTQANYSFQLTADTDLFFLSGAVSGETYQHQQYRHDTIDFSYAMRDEFDDFSSFSGKLERVMTGETLYIRPTWLSMGGTPEDKQIGVTNDILQQMIGKWVLFDDQNTFSFLRKDISLGGFFLTFSRFFDLLAQKKGCSFASGSTLDKKHVFPFDFSFPGLSSNEETLLQGTGNLFIDQEHARIVWQSTNILDYAYGCSGYYSTAEMYFSCQHPETSERWSMNIIPEKQNFVFDFSVTTPKGETFLGDGTFFGDTKKIRIQTKIVYTPIAFEDTHIPMYFAGEVSFEEKPAIPEVLPTAAVPLFQIYVPSK